MAQYCGCMYIYIIILYYYCIIIALYFYIIFNINNVLYNISVLFLCLFFIIGKTEETACHKSKLHKPGLCYTLTQIN